MRPRDHGDLRPSDLDDGMPASPVDGFGEADFIVGRVKGKKRTLTDPAGFVPDLGVDDAPPAVKPIFIGTIIQKLSRNRYKVLRSDGKTITAIALSSLPFEELKPGHDVALILDVHWQIVGKSRPKELPVLQLYTSGKTCKMGSSFIIGFDSVLTNSPIDDTFTDTDFESIKIKEPGVIEVLSADEALYEINYSIAVEAAAEGSLSLAEKCVDLTTTFHVPWRDFSVPTTRLNVDPQSGLRLRIKDTGTETYLTQKSEVHDSIMNQRADRYYTSVDGPPMRDDNLAVWTDSPRIGGSLTICTKKNGWLKINGQTKYAQQHYVWLKSGHGQLKLVFPNTTPQHDSFLVGSGDLFGHGGSQLDWQRFGFTGVLQYRDCNNQCSYLSFNRGLLMNVTGAFAGVNPLTAFWTNSDPVGDFNDTCGRPIFPEMI